MANGGAPVGELAQISAVLVDGADTVLLPANTSCTPCTPLPFAGSAQAFGAAAVFARLARVAPLVGLRPGTALPELVIGVPPTTLDVQVQTVAPEKLKK